MDNTGPGQRPKTGSISSGTCTGEKAKKVPMICPGFLRMLKRPDRAGFSAYRQKNRQKLGSKSGFQQGLGIPPEVIGVVDIYTHNHLRSIAYEGGYGLYIRPALE